MCSARHLSLRREDSFEPTALKPYQVRLDKGTIVYAPVDEDSVIRAERNQDHKVSLAAIVHHMVHHMHMHMHIHGTPHHRFRTRKSKRSAASTSCAKLV